MIKKIAHAVTRSGSNAIISARPQNEIRKMAVAEMIRDYLELHREKHDEDYQIN